MMRFFLFISLIWSALAYGSRIDHSAPKEYYPVDHGTGNSIDLLVIIIEHGPHSSPHREGPTPEPNLDIRPNLPHDRDTHRGSEKPGYFNDRYAEFMHRGPETFDPRQFPGYGNAFPYGADYSYAFRESNFEKRERAQHELDSYLADGTEELIKRDQRDCQLADKSIQRMNDFVEKRNTFLEGIEHLDFSDQRRAVVDTASSVMRAAKESFIDNNPLEWFEAGATMAETLLDLAIDFTPGASWAKDLYESITGKSLVTGKNLDEFTRSMCVFGALTLGFGSKAKHAIRVLGRTRSAATIGKSYETGKGLFESLKHLFKTGGKKPSQIINEIGDAARKSGLGDKIEKTLKSATEPAKTGGDITKLGHAFQKHANRNASTNPSRWGKVSGSNVTKNEAGLKHFNEILEGPGKFQKITTSEGKAFLEKRLSDGRGIRLNQDGTFKGFLDP